MKKFLLTLCAIVVSVNFLMAQSGEITGQILDENGEGIPFANVAAEKSGSIVTGTTTDFDGWFTIKPLDPGNYDIRVSYVGYNSSLTQGVLVKSDRITEVSNTLSPKSEILDVVEIIEYRVPLIDKNDQATKNTITKEEIAVLPTKNVNSIASTTASVYQEDEGGSVNIKGSRSDASEYFIDGIKVRGSVALPASAIEQLTVITGGVAAKYGDASGGIITITTRGPAREFSGEIELVTSSFLDDYNHNNAAFSLSGPLWTKGKGTDEEKPIAGIFISGEYLYEKDADPSAIGVWTIKDDVLADLEDIPLEKAVEGDAFILKAQQVTFDDLKHNKAKPNVAEQSYGLAGKLDIMATDNVRLTFGGSLRYKKYKDWIERYTLFNSENNPLYTDLSWRLFARFTQKFKTNTSTEEDGQKTQSAFQNAYYSVQFDYSKYREEYMDEGHEFNPFNYGYIGKFDTYREPIFQHGVDPTSGKSGWLLAGYRDTLVEYTPGTLNPTEANYTSTFYELAGGELVDGKWTAAESGNQEGFYENLFDIALGNGLINGFRPNAYRIYDVWFNPGRQFNGYGIDDDDDQYSLTVNGSVDILRPGASNRSKHALEFGFTFEQRVDRFYRISPVQLWLQAFQLTNTQLFQLEDSVPIFVVEGQQYTSDPGNFGANDTILYDRKYVAADQSYFDRNLRESLGLAVDGLDIIDVYSLDPEAFSLDMFSADELLNGGNSYIAYAGYDYLGNKLSTQPAFEDFFKEYNDLNGNGQADPNEYTRPVGAFRPIYTAAYLQDQFFFKDLSFNIGVRIDRFDANQKVLKDKFSLYQVHSAQEVANQGLLGDIPSSIGDDFAVYVDDFNNPTRIIGYRDDEVWYNTEGSEIFDPAVIEKASTTGQITPYLVNPEDDIKSEDFEPSSSFEDYEPQISVMPRIQFSFNITDEASFFAHYDVLTQRPPSRTNTTPDTWLFFEDNIGTFVNNPNLKPEKTIDYQIGFKQRVSKTSAVTISAFYRELRDMVQARQINYAYPRNYFTYDNIDFGTVKGLSIAYDMRRTGNVTLKANYAIQFAEGTGSDDASQRNLVNSGQPNLRSINPLSYDARHTINVTADYSWRDGKDYNGPQWGGKQVLANGGINLIVKARSGTPYTQHAEATGQAFISTVERTQLEGRINGSRLPWNYRVDMRIYKDFNLRFKESDGEKSVRPLTFNIYFLVQNLFNASNVNEVYAYTGSATDDGYLASAEGQQSIGVQPFAQSFIDLYSLGISDPDHFSIPRRMRLGAKLLF